MTSKPASLRVPTSDPLSSRHFDHPLPSFSNLILSDPPQGRNRSRPTPSVPPPAPPPTAALPTVSSENITAPETAYHPFQTSITQVPSRDIMELDLAHPQPPAPYQPLESHDRHLPLQPLTPSKSPLRTLFRNLANASSYESRSPRTPLTPSFFSLASPRSPINGGVPDITYEIYLDTTRRDLQFIPIPVDRLATTRRPSYLIPTTPQGPSDLFLDSPIEAIGYSVVCEKVSEKQVVLALRRPEQQQTDKPNRPVRPDLPDQTNQTNFIATNRNDTSIIPLTASTIGRIKRKDTSTATNTVVARLKSSIKGTNIQVFGHGYEGEADGDTTTAVFREKEMGSTR